MANINQLILPRRVRPAPAPLGLYLRAGRYDKRVMLDLLAADDANCFGFVFDAKLLQSNVEFRDQALRKRLDLILDPQTQPSATPGGYSEALGKLPWGVERQHCREDFEGQDGRRLVAAIARFAVENRATQVLAPTHLLKSADDEWFPIDLENISRLRAELDREASERIPIVGSLAIPYATLRDPAQLRVLVEGLRSAPIDSLWLRIDGLGARCTASATLWYIEGATQFHSLRIPVLADGMGGMPGLGLVAFGGAGGLVHGITLGERFDSSNWRQMSTGKPFAPHHRVYVQGLDLFLKPSDASAFLRSSNQTRTYGCRDSGCCPNGITDMLQNPARHFLIQRMKQLGALAQIPETMRARVYVDRMLRHTTDQLVAVSDLTLRDAQLLKSFRDQRRRLDSIRRSLGHILEEPRHVGAPLPSTRAARELHVRL